MLVILGIACVGISLLCYPQGEWVYLFGYRLGGECGLQMQLGIPCPQCGMSRSWVHLVRGRLWESLTYNAAGTLLLVWAVIASIQGALRLLFRNPRAFRVPWGLLVAWAVFWLAVPYVGLYTARLAGVNPLPEAPLPPGPTLPPGLPRGYSSMAAQGGDAG